MTTAAQTPSTNDQAAGATDAAAAKPIAAAALKVKVAKAKKIASTAAVIPMVNAKTKEVFLKIVKANAEISKAAALKALAPETRNLSYFEGDAKAFVAQHGIENITIWKSRIATVQPLRVGKSALNQLDFWARNGYTVVNKADFAVPADTAANAADAGSQPAAA